MSEASASLGAYVTVKYRCPNICAPEDLAQAGMSFEEMVRLLIGEDGVIGLQDAEQIVCIEQFDDATPPDVGRAR